MWINLHRDHLLTEIGKIGLNYEIFKFFGLCIDFFGAMLVIAGVVMTEKKAIQIGTPRLAPDDESNRDEIETVANLIHQSRLALMGAIALAIGFMLQAVAVWPFKYFI
jgi:hypothetical protein